ncbi:MAG: DMT family transporter [Nanoarchaeota archaeon]
MLWVLLAILAAFIWAAVNIVDKYVLTKWVKNPVVPVIFTGIIGITAGIIILLFRGVTLFSIPNFIWVIISGILHTIMTWLFFSSVKHDEVSRVIPVFYLTPVFVLIFAAIFLGEVFTPIKYLGIAFLIISAIAVSIRFPFRIRLGKGFWFMLLAAISSAVVAVITKHLLNSADYWTVFAYMKIASIFVLIPVMFLYLPDLVAIGKKHGKKPIIVMAANETVNIFALFLFTIATAVGFVTLVQSLSSVQPFFVLLFAVILSIFFPKILKEEVSKKTVFLKLMATVFVVVGAILII